MGVSLQKDHILVGGVPLQVSRAIGHPDLTSSPEVIQLEMEEHHQVLILATKGVWDRLSADHAVKIGLESEEAQSAATRIVNTARSLNPNKDQQDDATAIVVYFDLTNA